MDFNTWSFIQRALIFVFEPVMGYWLVGLTAAGILTAVYILFLSLVRWLTSKEVI